MDSDVYIYGRAVLALAFVTGLIVLLSALIKRTGLDKRIIGNKSSATRLSVTETLYLDPKRRLVLVKCDDEEHLLLLGTSGDLFIPSEKGGEKA